LTQTAIPFFLMRGGTSRGVFMNVVDVPKDLKLLEHVLIAAIGAGEPLNIDGIGGGTAVTTKVAILSKSEDEWADIDYFFAQVGVEEQSVDFKPTCGNIMSAVGPAAIEMGLYSITQGVNKIKIRAVNTGARVIAKVKTDGTDVVYEGKTKIDGVLGTSARIELHFSDVTGSYTGAFLPTGHLRDTIDGVDVTCMDVAVPMVIARAKDIGVSGYETRKQLDANGALFERLESIRVQAGFAMGMGDCSKSVTPKLGLLAPAKKGGDIAVRYFMPWAAHPSVAVTGSQCLAACALTPGTVSDGLLQRPRGNSVQVTLEHPMGVMDVFVDCDQSDGFSLKSAGIIRTARKLACGTFFIPKAVWEG